MFVVEEGLVSKSNSIINEKPFKIVDGANFRFNRHRVWFVMIHFNPNHSCDRLVSCNCNCIHLNLKHSVMWMWTTVRTRWWMKLCTAILILILITHSSYPSPSTSTMIGSFFCTNHSLSHSCCYREMTLQVDCMKNSMLCWEALSLLWLWKSAYEQCPHQRFMKNKIAAREELGVTPSSQVFWTQKRLVYRKHENLFLINNICSWMWLQLVSKPSRVPIVCEYHRCLSEKLLVGKTIAKRRMAVIWRSTGLASYVQRFSTFICTTNVYSCADDTYW